MFGASDDNSLKSYTGPQGTWKCYNVDTLRCLFERRLSGRTYEYRPVSADLGMALRRERNAMTTRTTSKMVTFARPFTLKGVDRLLPTETIGSTDEELIEELSFPVYRRVSTMIFVPGKSASSVEMVAIDPQDLQVAQGRTEPGRLIFQTKTVRMMHRGHRASFQIHFGVFVAAGKQAARS